MSCCLYIVIPCYNEEEVLLETAKQLLDKMTFLIENHTIYPSSKIVFVNDGSKDNTWNIIKDLHNKNPIFCGINLSRNTGHQNALMAGLTTVYKQADAVISMDADLQDDIDAIDKMVEKYNYGCDIVYGVRSKRNRDSFFKRFTAEAFYRVMSKMGVETVFNHADYRLMSRRAIEGLMKFKEVNLFLRGIVPKIGYKSDIVYYERKPRFAGESKYPLKKMISFAFEGITSLSVKPIHFITALGSAILFFGLLFLIVSISTQIIARNSNYWFILISSLWTIGGLILVSIGLVGEYIGKIYLETKERPRFIIEEYLYDGDSKIQEPLYNENTDSNSTLLSKKAT